MRVWILVTSVALSTAACGPDCAALCEAAKDCGGAEQDDEVEETDCEESCEKAEKKAEAAGCESEYEEALSCTDEQEDICKLDDCADEQKALSDCVSN